VPSKDVRTGRILSKTMVAIYSRKGMSLTSVWSLGSPSYLGRTMAFSGLVFHMMRVTFNDKDFAERSTEVGEVLEIA